jgi:hypothetical protein
MRKQFLRQRSHHNLVTATYPSSRIGEELQSLKSSLASALFEGLEIKKVCSDGKITTRVISLSCDLYKLLLSRTKNRRILPGKRSVSKVVGMVMATKVDHKQFNIRVIDIADILFLQSGILCSQKLEKAAALRNSDRFDPAKVISIFHGNNLTTDIIVEDDDDRKSLISSIQIIRGVYYNSTSKLNIRNEELLLRYAWYDVDWDRTGLLDLTGFLRLLRIINIYIKKEKATKMYRDYCAEIHPELLEWHSFRSFRRRRSGSKLGIRSSNSLRDRYGLSFYECLGLLQRIKCKQSDGKRVGDVIFEQLLEEGTKSVAAENFAQFFLVERQHNHEATIDDAKKIIRAYSRSEDGETFDRLGFEEYLFSSDNDLFDPIKQRFDESILNKSLSEYWISSSHNTYLTGDQLQSPSSLEAYTVALQRGCKCLELDCFDSAAGVVVYHIYTATTAILFRDIVTIVKNYVNTNPNTLPIILSLDNHCSLPFQENMAQIIKTELKNILHYPCTLTDTLPSPKDLVGKVILKGRRTGGKDDGISETTRTTASNVNVSRVSRTARKLSFHAKSKNVNASEDAIDTTFVAPELAELTLLNTVRNKDDFSEASVLPVTDMVSFSETKVLRIINNNEQKATCWKNFNKTHMTRTYPSGTRVDSSNFNPVLHWSLGCQMVALNFQTVDSSMTINDGRFRENGGCGYVLKSVNSFPGNNMSLRITVLSGSCLPKPYGESSGEVISPYVIIRLHDVVTQPSDERLKVEERKTHKVQDNGFCPQWTGAKEFSFKVENPGVAMLQFTVHHSDEGFIDDTICRTAIPVRCLRQGLRSVHFYDSNSQRGSLAFARLLVNVKIEDHIPWK